MRTLFLRLLEADDKGTALENTLAAWRDGHETGPTFSPDPETFGEVPGSPFSYWASDRIRALFREHPPFEGEGRTVKQGLATADDFRFVRCWWEVDPATLGKKWFPFAKGGKYSPFYADVHLVVNWKYEGQEIHAFDKAYVRNAGFYFRPGLTWPRRTCGLSIRSVPRGTVFGDKGPMVFLTSDDPSALMALNCMLNSKPFGYLVSIQLARTELAQSYEVGLIQKTAMPAMDRRAHEEMSRVGMAGWRVQRSLIRHTPTSHAFELPALLQVADDSLAVRENRWSERVHTNFAKFTALRSEADNAAFVLYGIGGRDRLDIEQGFESTTGESKTVRPIGDPVEAEAHDAAVSRNLSASLVEWCIGVAFGRFDIRLATGNRRPPREPGPFEPLPAASPGMLTNEVGLPGVRPPAGYPIPIPSDGILVDDPGHDADIVRRVRQVFDLLDLERGHAWLTEACESLGSALRTWIARSFFDVHLRQHSMSRRKAPLFWQLGPRTRSYSIWLYYPRLTHDTLYRVVTDYVGPKLRHEEERLDELEAVTGTSPTAAQRRELEGQRGFVDELRTFCADIARVAPLWRPAMDDGVILNVAPLWHLLGANRSWQREAKKKWVAMAEGKYDWAQWAMHLWPERVVPKCVDDRSLAIAHDLIDAFWVEQSDNRWKRVRLSDTDIRAHINRRQSPAVRAALDSLLTA